MCFSHTLNNAGRRFDFPELDNFAQLWTSLFAHSQEVKLAWKVTTGMSMRRLIADQMVVQMGDAEPSQHLLW